LALDQAGIEQHFQVLRHGRAGYRQAGGEFIDGLRAAPQLFQKMAPVGKSAIAMKASENIMP
jgi:hypothetical protein